MTIVRVITALVAACALAACAAVPIPIEIDLRARMGGATTGSVQVPVVPGEAEQFGAALPSADGQCFDLSGDDLPVTVQSAQLHWRIDVAYDGPDLTGEVQARLFVAGPGDDLFDPSNALGPSVAVPLDGTTTSVAGTGALGASGLQALADRSVCWGVQLTGTDVVAGEAGVATFSYDVRELRVRLGVSVI
jgi:hypothetical protein